MILRAGETLASERVIDACGAWVTTALHFVYEVYALSGDEGVIPPAFHGIWEQYFGGDSTVIGRSIPLSDVTHQQRLAARLPGKLDDTTQSVFFLSCDFQ